MALSRIREPSGFSRERCKTVALSIEETYDKSVTTGGGQMVQTVVSSKYQIVIPKEVRRQLDLEKGQILQVVVRNGVITLVPDRPISELRGFLKGMEATGLRDEEDRL
jgi:AbrB family looped-hinge helix DNA binding protein